MFLIHCKAKAGRGDSYENQATFSYFKDELLNAAEINLWKFLGTVYHIC